MTVAFILLLLLLLLFLVLMKRGSRDPLTQIAEKVEETGDYTELEQYILLRYGPKS